MTLVEKILSDHVVHGQLTSTELLLRADQALVQDNTGSMVFLQFEAIGIPRVRVDTFVYIDHNLYQFDVKNSDDHAFIESAARRFGCYLARPGAGICHQVHRERFARPGTILVGADSHTPTAGGLGCLAVGAGGLDVALVMAGAGFHLSVPRVMGIRLHGRLRPWVSAKDAALELLRQLGVRGGVGRVLEFFGPGIASLNVPERCTLTNLSAEMGATSAIFPSDDRTLDYLRRFGRETDWRPLAADTDSRYDEIIDLNLDLIEPLVACPSSPDNVRPVRELAGEPIRQVIVGSCTNGSYSELRIVAEILRGRHVHANVQLVVAPASRAALSQLTADGGLTALLDAGAIISEATCGACIGFGHVPATGSASLRTFNRNFRGRSGLSDDRVYLGSPELAGATALAGTLVDPRELGEPPQWQEPNTFILSSVDVSPPVNDPDQPIVRGPHIGHVPQLPPPPGEARGIVLLKLGDNVSTDDIIPARSQISALRSNILRLADYTFERMDEGFAARAKQLGGGFLVAGENYGQGSSREHAAICPRVLGIHAVIAKSFARIHRANMIAQGLAPLLFSDLSDYGRLEPGDELAIPGLHAGLAAAQELSVRNLTRGTTFSVRPDALTGREARILAIGGLLADAREHPLAG